MYFRRLSFIAPSCQFSAPKRRIFVRVDRLALVVDAVNRPAQLIEPRQNRNSHAARVRVDFARQQPSLDEQADEMPDRAHRVRIFPAHLLNPIPALVREHVLGPPGRKIATRTLAARDVLRRVVHHFPDQVFREDEKRVGVDVGEFRVQR
jgi:hypothetical protein